MKHIYSVNVAFLPLFGPEGEMLCSFHGTQWGRCPATRVKGNQNELRRDMNTIKLAVAANLCENTHRT